MAHPRHRDDSSPTVYHVTNSLVGEVGELLLDERQMGKLSLLIRQADRLYCVNVVSFEVNPSGYSLVCAAPSELPSPDEVRAHYMDRYGKRRQMPDFDDPDIYAQWAARLRDFSRLIKDIQQCFTQWYNRAIRLGKRKGTLWKSRFESGIVATAVRALAAVRTCFGKPAPTTRLRKVQGQGWRKLKKGHSFLRDTALPVLATSGRFAHAVAYVLLDELSGFPAAFPVRILRDIVGSMLPE